MVCTFENAFSHDKRNKSSVGREEKALVANIPPVFLHIMHDTVLLSLSVLERMCINFMRSTRSHINYNQIGYRSCGVSIERSLAEGHEALSPESKGIERGMRKSHFNESFIHVK